MTSPFSMGRPTAAPNRPFPPEQPAWPLLSFDGSDAALTDALLVPLRGVVAGVVWSLLSLFCGAGGCSWFCCVGTRLAKGIGTWGNNIPVAWAFGITDFVWWIGIGHAGTFISAFFSLEPALARVDQPYRRGDDDIRLGDAGLFPILHLGRPWFFYWLVPYPGDDGRMAQLQERFAVGHCRG